jgi:hypothetical protein
MQNRRPVPELGAKQGSFDHAEGFASRISQFAQDDSVEKATALPWLSHSRVPFYTLAGGDAKYLYGVGSAQG